MNCFSAAAVEKSDSVIHFKEVEVTASRIPTATRQTLSGTKLQALSSTSIADALKYFAGVQIKDYGGLGGLKTINVRSLGAQHVGVYIDGIRITNAQNGTVDLGKFSLSTLESVSLYNANKLDFCQSPSEYASGATVYMTTRRPQADSLSVLVGAGSFSTWRARLTGEFSRKGWCGFLDGEYLKSRGDYPFRYHSAYEDTVGRRKNSDIEYLRVEGALFRGGFSSHVYCYVSERGCPGGIVRRLSDKYTNIGREWDRDLFVQGAYERRIARIHQLKFNLKYTDEYLRYNTDYPDNQNTARVDNHYWQRDIFASAAYSVRPVKWLAVNAGYDARVSWLDADLKKFCPIRRFDQKAVIALQADWRCLRLAGSALYQHMKDHTRLKVGAARPLSRFTPAVTLAWAPGDLSVRAWYKCIFRAPTLNDLYYTQAGNRNLKPEYTRQWNLGAEYHLSRAGFSFSAQADAYLNYIENRIVCLPLKGTYTWSMMNYGRTFCRGLNSTISAAYALRDWQFSLLCSFTLQKDLNRTDPDDKATYNQPICYSPLFSSGQTLIVGWRMLQLTVSNLYVGERMWSYADPEDILTPYSNVDMKLTAKIWRFSLSGEVNDLLDVQYEHIPRYPMPGRNFKLTVTFSL
ncbi:MAG: TonB-dependent receptor [Muribaculaceae bacterium]|nr:TonB-dependent receptor [Muribaculaceae bacterium]